MVLKLLQRNLRLVGLAAAATAAVLVVPAVANAAPGTPNSGNGSVDQTLNSLLDALAGGGKPTPSATATTQLLVATGKDASDTTGTLTGYERAGTGDWKIVIEPVKAFFDPRARANRKTTSRARPVARSRWTRPSGARRTRAPKCPTARSPQRTGGTRT